MIAQHWSLSGDADLGPGGAVCQNAADDWGGAGLPPPRQAGLELRPQPALFRVRLSSGRYHQRVLWRSQTTAVAATWWLTYAQIEAAEALLDTAAGGWFGMRCPSEWSGGLARLHFVRQAGDWSVTKLGPLGAQASLALLVRPVI